MKKVKIKVTYDGELDTEIDNKMHKIMEVIGAKWWAQGYDLVDNVRDIAYDLEIKV